MRGSKWRVTGRSVLITGAVEGIGAATARLLATRKTHLSLLDVRGDALRQLASNLGGGAMCQKVDITQHEALDAAVAATLDRFGRLDVVLVNAGVVTVGSVERGDPQAFERVITVNLMGAWLVPDVFQLVVEGLARRHGWAAAIREHEQANGGKDA